MKKQTITKSLLLAVCLLVGGVNVAWAEASVQNLGSTDATSWTATSGTGIKHGSTVTIKNVVMTFGGGSYSTAQTVSGTSYTDDQWDYVANTGLRPIFMPNNDDTSNGGVASIAVDGTLPTHGAVYKFEVSVAGTLTVGFKGGTKSGKIMLVQADDTKKVTKIVDDGAATDQAVTKNYTLEAGTYYFFQCAHATNQVSGYRGSFQSFSFEALAPVEGLKVWNFEQSGWSTIATSSPVGVIQDQLWLSGSIEYDGTNHRYKAAKGTDNQIRFKVKQGQTGRVVIVGKADNSNYGIKLTIGDGTAATVCRGSINKVHTSDKVTCSDADKEIVITADASAIALLKKVAWVPETETNKAVTLGNAGFSTFCPMTNVTIPSGVKAYRLYSIDGTTATWTEFSGKIPGLTGALLVGEGGQGYTFNAATNDQYGINATGATSDYNGTTTNKEYNYLVGTYAETAIPASDATTSYYGLIKNTNTFGKVTANVNIPAGMAYFSLTGSTASAREFTLSFDDEEATGISSVESVQHKGDNVFSLSGQRLSAPRKGLNIVDGKKVIIK